MEKDRRTTLRNRESRANRLENGKHGNLNLSDSPLSKRGRDLSKTGLDEEFEYEDNNMEEEEEEGEEDEVSTDATETTIQA